MSRLATRLIVLAGLVTCHSASARKITIKNSCGQTVYPAYAGEGGSATMGGSPAPAGWELSKDAETVLDVPEQWSKARVWIRSGGCGSDVANCQIGACKSKELECDGKEYGSLGATVAEFTLAEQDFYDVSMDEGFTISMSITPSDSACTVGSCGVEEDILKKCDSRLILPAGGSQAWACANPCTAKVQFTALAGNNFDWLNSPSCCNGIWADDKCTHDVIPFYNELKPLCRNGYVYAKDDLPFDGEQTAVWSCNSKPSYTVDLCAGGFNTGLQAGEVSVAAVGGVMDPGSGGALNVGDGTDISSGDAGSTPIYSIASEDGGPVTATRANIEATGDVGGTTAGADTSPTPPEPITTTQHFATGPTTDAVPPFTSPVDSATATQIQPLTTPLPISVETAPTDEAGAEGGGWAHGGSHGGGHAPVEIAAFGRDQTSDGMTQSAGNTCQRRRKRRLGASGIGHKRT